MPGSAKQHGRLAWGQNMACRVRLKLAVILLGVSACHTWTHVSTPDEAIARAGTGTIQVTKTDLSVVLIQSPAIIQDTLIGTSVDREHIRVAIPIGEVGAVATQEVSLWRTAGAGYLTVLGALGLTLLVFTFLWLRGP
jgi:hypothetical protein